MIPSLKGQLADWQYARQNTITFLQQLTPAQLQQPLPRQTFTTLWEQMIEMAWVQHCFMAAVATGTLNGTNWEAPHYPTKEDLLAAMATFDQEMITILENCTGNETIDWFGEEKSIFQHLSSLQSHEMMHLGQIIAFCHALDIPIPADVTKSMHLTG